MRRIRSQVIWVVAALALLSACSNEDGGGPTPGPTRTATRTAIAPTIPATSTATIAIPATIPATSTVTPLVTSAPTATPTSTVGSPGTATPSGAASFSALIVLRGDVRASSGDALGAPPANWIQSPSGATFDRALAHASWRITGPAERTGETNADGSIDLDGLPAGDYSLELQKSLDGNLIGADVPFHIGSGGEATLVIEIAQGLVRATNEWNDGGVAMREITAANGARIVTRDGAVRELRGSGRSYVDADGDGSFDATNCDTSPGVWLCSADRDCGADRTCSCAGSCPFCEDCPVSVCVPPDVRPYSCAGDHPCANEGDRCVCVSSCPECDDCAASTCVPSTCEPSQIAAIDVIGPSILVLGQGGAMSATARLTDGWSIDVTQLVTWTSSNAATLSVDGWGTLLAKAIGTADVSATLASLESEPWSIEVKERPALKHLYVQNLDCVVAYGLPEIGPGGISQAPRPDGTIAPPDCRQVVRAGTTLRYFVLGEFENGYYENVTGKVTWTLDPAGVGSIDEATAVFTAVQVGTTTLTAHLDGVASDGSVIKVVDQPTIIAIQIYPLAAIPRPGPLPPDDAAPGAAFPCYDCGYAVTLLKGDSLPFHATAAYDTGEWEDVSERVTWSSSETAVAPIDAHGELRAAAAGETIVTATLAEVTSNWVTVKVVETATLLSLSIYQENIDRVVESGDQVFFRALGYYDVGFDRDATASATWKSSDVTIGSFTTAGVFVGHAAGNVQIWAELDGIESNHLPIEVFQESSLDYCDAAAINRAEWSDAFNRVVLDSDCASYTPPAIASLRFTVTERERPAGIFDPCLDLYVYQGARLVRTIRKEGCGMPFLPTGAPAYDEEALKYQSLAFWDLKDDRGAVVAPGSYTVRGVFYLYYDPIIELGIVVGGQE